MVSEVLKLRTLSESLKEEESRKKEEEEEKWDLDSPNTRACLHAGGIEDPSSASPCPTAVPHAAPVGAVAVFAGEAG